MNDNYIIRHLIIWSELLYGKDAKCFAETVKRKNKKGKKTKYYIFGSEKLDIKNTISKEFALYLVASKLPGDVTKVRYQIKYFDLEAGINRLHSHGAVYTPDQIKKEIKSLKNEQKQLKTLKLPKTKTNFEKVKVTVI